MAELDNNSIGPDEIESNFDDSIDDEYWDPLLSVQDIAREFGVHTQTIADLVAARTVRSIDGGLLAREGVLDVPVARLSWANEIRKDSDQAWRRIDDPDSGMLHPAAAIATEFYNSLRDGDWPKAMNQCLPETVENVSEELFVAVVEAVLPQEVFSSSSGMTSGVYTLDPLDAYAVRIIRDAEYLPQVIDRPTPVTLIAVVPLRYSDGSLGVDFNLLIEQIRLREILQSGSDPNLKSLTSSAEEPSE